MSSLILCHVKRTALVLSVVTLAAGCGKQKELPAPETPAAAPAETPAAAPAAAPVAQPVAGAVDVNQSFAAADAAMKAKAYDKAVQAMLAVQNQRQLSDQQAEAARNRMIGLQASLAQAVASGDPSAKAAADMLRAAHTVR